MIEIKVQIILQGTPPMHEGAYGDDFTSLMADTPPQHSPAQLVGKLNSPHYELLSPDEKLALLLECVNVVVRPGMSDSRALAARRLLIDAAWRMIPIS
jgi:hypothetical protein